MKAFVYERPGSSRFVPDYPAPRAREDSAIIKVLACSVCGTDLRAWRHGSERIAAPRITGHELCGLIVELGPRRVGFTVGQRVSIAPAIGCGSCAPCRRGHPNLCDSLRTVGFQFDGGFAEYLEVPAAAFEAGNVYPTPDGVPDETAALAEPIACVLNGQEMLDIRPGDSVAGFGSGFIGCMHAELARMKGADPVILVEPNPARARAAHALVPFASLIVSSEADVDREVHALTGGDGIDALITACPAGQAQRDAVRLAAKRGRVSLFGGLPGESTGFLDSNLIHYKELAVHGVHASTPAQNREVMAWIGQRRIDPARYVSRIYALEETERAFVDLERQAVFKAVVRPDGKGSGVR
jgi:L-iditol 2-dehydrogenase